VPGSLSGSPLSFPVFSLVVVLLFLSCGSGCITVLLFFLFDILLGWGRSSTSGSAEADMLASLVMITRFSDSGIDIVLQWHVAFRVSFMQLTRLTRRQIALHVDFIQAYSALDTLPPYYY